MYPRRLRTRCCREHPTTGRQLVGVNHLGFQADSNEELRGLHAQLQAADSQLIQEDAQACCVPTAKATSCG